MRTLTDLYIENMLRPFAAFLHDNGIALRAEISYGLPFELTRPGPEVDGVETESLEFGAQIDAYRLMAGPAHLFGKQYSSETGATTRNHMLDHRFYDQIIATQLAAGITKTVLHGWASTAGAEGVTEWPGHEGMWPMFSERFDTRQPAAEFYPLWTAALGRYQYVLRQGKPRIDVAAKLLDWGRQGLKVLLVHGARELKLLLQGLYTTHDRAAARTPGLDGRDEELAVTVAELLTLPTVAEIDDPALTVNALRSLGVVGRAELTSENRSLLSHLREGGDLLHLYLTTSSPRPASRSASRSRSPAQEPCTASTPGPAWSTRTAAFVETATAPS